MKSSRNIVIIALLSALSATWAEDELLMVLEVSRHGAREPSKIFNFTVDPTKNFNSTGNLMPMGKKQHFDLGSRLRQKYIIENQFLSPNFTENEVHIQTTYLNRTYLSSLYQLLGMYPNDQPTLEDYEKFNLGHEEYLSDIQKNGQTNHKNSSFTITQIDQTEDFLLHVDDNNCPRYGLAATDSKESDDYQDVQDYFTTNYKQKLEKLIGRTISSAKEMNEICSYLQWAELAGLELTFKPTAEDDAYCLAFGDSKLYSVSYGLEELWKLSSYNFMSELVQIGNTLWNQTSNSLPKFVHYAAHAETLAEFFDGLGLHRSTRVFPSSALILEFLQNTDSQSQNHRNVKVRMIYYDGEKQTEQVLKFANQTEDTIDLPAFQNHILQRLDRAGVYDVQQKCQQTSDFLPLSGDYYSGEQVIEDLKSVYQLKEYFFEEAGFLQY